MQSSAGITELTLETRMLGALVLREGNDVKLSVSELASIRELDVKVDPVAKTVRIHAGVRDEFEQVQDILSPFREFFDQNR